MITGKSIQGCIWLTAICEINVREYRRGNQKWTIQRNWQHEEKQNKNKAQYVLDTTMHKQTQIT